MMPLTTEELTYEERWAVDCHLMWTPVATIQQQYADALDLTLVDVQVTYPN
jgi:pentose-5-phosphate-3-epimerase